MGVACLSTIELKIVLVLPETSKIDCYELLGEPERMMVGMGHIYFVLLRGKVSLRCSNNEASIEGQHRKASIHSFT